MFTIRRAVTHDLDAIVDLRMAFLMEEQPDAMDSVSAAREAVRQYVMEKLPKDELLIWFAEAEGRIVGTSGLVFFHKPPTLRNASPMQAYVHNMYTLPEWRGQGIATALLRGIIEYVKSTPARRIWLHASDQGRPIYERLGFTPVDNEMMLALVD